MQLDSYIRVSDTRGRSGPTFIAPDVQRDRIAAWATANGHEVIAVHEEMDVSGGKMRRPMLDEVMRRIDAGETGGVVVWKLDRFGRTLVGSLELIKRINEKGALFASVTDNFDITTPNGRLVLNLMLSIAQFELERIGDTWLESRARATRRGHHMGRVAPFGYRKRAEDGRLEVDPLTGPFVTEIFQRRASGQSWTPIREWLRKAQVLSSSGRVWTTAGLSRLVRNEVYLGVLIDRGSGERLEGAHPPLVDRATWQAVQQHHGVRYSGKPADSLLRGLARCSSCRYGLAPNGVGGKQTNGVERSDRYYRCSRAHSANDCPQPAFLRMNSYMRPRRGALVGLDEYVLERVFERLPEIEARAYGIETEVAELDAAAKAARAELHAYAADTELEQAAGRDAFLAGLEKRRVIAEQAERERDVALRLNAGRLQQPTRRLREDWEQMTLADQREALDSVITAVFVGPPTHSRHHEGASDARVHIVWADDPPVDLPRQGRRDYIIQPFVFPNGSHHPGQIGEAVA